MINQEIENLFKTLWDKWQITPEALVSREKKQHKGTLAFRIWFAKKMEKLKYSSVAIGQILKRDHTTVLYYLGRLKREGKIRRVKDLKTKNFLGGNMKCEIKSKRLEDYYEQMENFKTKNFPKRGKTYLELRLDKWFKNSERRNLYKNDLLKYLLESGVEITEAKNLMKKLQ